MKLTDIMKVFSPKLLVAAAMLPLAIASSASVADEWDVPGIGAIDRYGAEMPYTRYDSEDAQMGGGAYMVSCPEVDPYEVASQGSNRNYIKLPNAGSYAEWTMHTQGDGVTVRFTLADSANGMGTESNLNVYVNGQKTNIIYRGDTMSSLPISSYNMWQYFGFGSGSPQDTPGGVGSFAFDENHFQLPAALKAGDRIRIESTGGRDCGVDFIEVEQVPLPIEPDGDYINIRDYGAGEGGDDVSAFVRALAAADNGPKCLYLPEGNYNFGSIVDVRCEGVKIMGAGIWHTNIMFTSANKQSGGFSGGNGYGNNGNPKIDDYNTNMEFCHMYINSRLRSRYGEQAVYKCFMDVWRGGSVIHDVWQEHFECGFWFGDYNGDKRNSSGVKVINCRIRNNFADGVNFCQSTSHAYVYNCNIRNCGDDGLAVWNATDQSAGEGKYNNDEIGDVFAYNTIDFIWRAGGIAIYGGDEHLIYNNYIRDMFMAAGIHVNDRYPGPKFENTVKGIHFWNNVLVGCGTDHDCWNEDFAAVDIIGGVKNVYFHNTQIYDSPFYAIRVQQNVSNINFEDTQILGSGLAGGVIDWSCSKHSPAAIRLMSSANFKNTTIGNVRDPELGRNDTWPIYTDNNAQLAQDVLGSAGYTFIPADECNYEVVGYPDASQAGGIIDPMEGVTGYNLTLTGLAWKDQNGTQTLYEGDTVQFLAEITNGNVEIPAGVTISLRIRIDDKTSLTVNNYKNGLKPGQKIILAPTAKWSAVTGAHTVVATVDYNNKLPNETNENDNERTKRFNVYDPQEGDEPNLDRVTGGYDLAVLSVGYVNAAGEVDGPAAVGETIRFWARVANIGDRDIPSGTKLGIQWQLDGASYGQGRIWWNDEHFGGLRAGEVMTFVPNGSGGAGYNGNDPTWTTDNKVHTLMAWIDDNDLFTDEVDDSNQMNPLASNNAMQISIQFPTEETTLWSEDDLAGEIGSPDNIDGTITDPSRPEGPTDPTEGLSGYNLVLSGLAWKDQNGSTTLYEGDDVHFLAQVTNDTDVDIPAGVTIQVQGRVDDERSISFPSITSGLKGGESVVVTSTTEWNPVAGAHTVVVVVDPNNRLDKETHNSDNDCTKNINVYMPTETPDYTFTPVKGGYDLKVLNVGYLNAAGVYKGTVGVGEPVVFHAVIANIGDRDIPAGQKLGIQFQLDGVGYNSGRIWWNDEYFGGLKAGATMEISASGGGQNGQPNDKNNIWYVTRGTHTIKAWVDDSDVFKGEIDDCGGNAMASSNNMRSATFTFPKEEPAYFPNPDMPDKVDDTIRDPEIPNTPNDPMAGIEGYNLHLYGLRWDKGADAHHNAVSTAAAEVTAPELKAGDAVKFSIRVDNTSNVDIPAGVAIKTRVVIDNSTYIYFPEIIEGLPGGEYRILTTDADWTATAGKHTAVATVDYNGRFIKDTDAYDNDRLKNFNVIATGNNAEPELTWTPVTGGVDLKVLDIKWQRTDENGNNIDPEPGHGPINKGDYLRWTAEVVNAGDAPVNSGVIIGVLFMPGVTNSNTWSDYHQSGLGANSRIALTANGGYDGSVAQKGIYSVGQNSTINISAWVDDQHRIGEVNDSNGDNTLSTLLNIPYAGRANSIEYHENPDFPDVLVSMPTAIEEIEENDIPADAVWYNLQGIRLTETPSAPGLYILNGHKVVIR